jgi:DNA polymerase sigma
MVTTVKFVDPITGLSCDINVNEQLGLLNSMMLKRYCDISPHLRFLIASVKAWAKPLGLNNPSNNRRRGFVSVTFSSYAFALMTIGFLQVSPEVEFAKYDLMGVEDRIGVCYLICRKGFRN